MPRKVVFVVVLFAAALSTSYSQFPSVAENQIQAGIGPTWIDNMPYYAVRVRPDLSLGKFGLGLDLNLEFDAHGSIRTEDYNEVSDYIALIRYLRYGTENDTLFLKLGALDYVTMGQGNIINMYNNSPTFDARKTGMQLGLNFEKFGIQTMWGNFAQAGVVGARAYVRPMKFTEAADVPVIGNAELGFTGAADLDKNANSIQKYSPAGYIITNQSSLGIMGLDIDFPVLRSDLAGIDLYGTYTKIINYGSGEAAGASFHLDLSLLVSARARLERRFNGDQYVPAYFNSLYEVERINVVTGSSKAAALRAATGSSNGYYGDLLIRVLNIFDIIGAFQKQDDVANSGIFHASTDIAPKDAPFIARAGYDKVNIENFSDLVTTDDRSYLYAELGYKPVEYLIASFVYSWTFTPVRDGETIVGFEPQKKIEPKITFVYGF